MIKEITFEHWKSFTNAKLFLDPLTVLIGANASGKSNALDGLLFLNRIALGKDLRAALSGDSLMPPLRGGVEWATLRPSRDFTISTLVAGKEPNIDYEYTITVQTDPSVQLRAESLIRLRYRSRTKDNPYRTSLYKTDEFDERIPALIARLYNEKRGRPLPVVRSSAVLTQLVDQQIRKEILDGVNTVLRALQGIFVLDPVPSRMRYFAPLSDVLMSDASNIAGVLACLPEHRQNDVVDTLTRYARELPEGDIRRVWSETVGRFNRDAMLYCEEGWARNEITTIDARGMSDGTLRYLSILTALLVRPECSQLVIEEVDNGLHPSRAGSLLNMLRDIGAERHIDILVTTHNPALLDALGPEMVPFVVIAYRDPECGDSRFKLLEDIGSLPKMLASGSLGRLVTRGEIEVSLHRHPEAQP